MRLLPDGRILVAANIPATGEVMLWRLASNGQIDSAFGSKGDGSQLVSVGDSLVLHAIHVQLDGSILLGGAQYPAGEDTALCWVQRHLADGSLDMTFTAPANLLSSIYPQQVMALGTQSDSKIVLAIWFEPPPPGPMTFQTDEVVLVRLLPDGTPDLSYGTDAQFLLPKGRDNQPRTLRVLPNDQVLVGGVDEEGFFVAKSFANGSGMDSTFGSSGFWSDRVGTSVRHDVLTLTQGGRIGYGGAYYDDGSQSRATDILQLNADGSYYAPPGSPGGRWRFVVIGSLNSRSHQALHGLVFQPDSHAVYLAENRDSVVNGREYRSVYLTGVDERGIPDFSFASGGRYRLEPELQLGKLRSAPGGLIRQPDGKLLALGWGHLRDTLQDDLAVFRITFDSLLAQITTPQDSWSLRVFPNPGRGQLHLSTDLSQPGHCVVSDMHGRVVHRQDISDNRSVLTIDTQAWPSGLYIIKFHSANQYTTRRWLKQ